MDRNSDTYLNAEQIGKRFPEYRKTYDFPGAYINESHRSYAECPLISDTLIDVGIQGWLRRADALKLYEMGYFTKGDVLEFGTYQGLSTSILSRANYDSGLLRNIYSVDIDRSFQDIAKNNLKERDLAKNVHFHLSDSHDFLSSMQEKGKKFGFVFIDHSHEFEPVFDVCRHLEDLLLMGGFCLFHDYNDPNSFDFSTKDFKVYQAVNEGLDKGRFGFYGIFGCTVLYRLCTRENQRNE